MVGKVIVDRYLPYSPPEFHPAFDAAELGQRRDRLFRSDPRVSRSGDRGQRVEAVMFALEVPANPPD